MNHTDKDEKMPTAGNSSQLTAGWSEEDIARIISPSSWLTNRAARPDQGDVKRADRAESRARSLAKARAIMALAPVASLPPAPSVRGGEWPTDQEHNDKLLLKALAVHVTYGDGSDPGTPEDADGLYALATEPGKWPYWRPLVERAAMAFTTIAAPSPPHPETDAREGGVEPDAHDLKERLHDLVMCKSEADALNGGGPGIDDRWKRAWANAFEVFEP